ncbi:unnamed protein product [Mucor fragilis]
MASINAEFKSHEQQLSKLATAQESRIASLKAELLKKDKRIEFLMDIEAVREKQVAYLEALYDNVSNGPNMQVMKLQSALVLEKHANNDLRFEHKLLEIQCKRYTHIEMPKLQESLKIADHEAQELQQTLQHTDEKVRQLEQNLSESYDKCQSLTAEMDMRADVDTEKLEKEVEARLTAYFDAKYDELHAAFKKLESLKGSYKDMIARLKQSHAEDLDLVREEERAKCTKESKHLRADNKKLSERCTESNQTIKELRIALKKAVTMKKGEEMVIPAPVSTSPSATKKTRASAAKSSRKTTTPVIDDDNGDDDFILSVKKPSRFNNVSPIKKVDDSDGDHDETTTSSKKAKQKENEYFDDLDDAAAYIMDLDASESNDQPTPTSFKAKQAKNTEAAAQKAKGKKAASKATTSAPSSTQKPSDDESDFASPVLPLASVESDTQRTRETTPMLPNLEEEEDAVSLVKPIRPKRRIRKLANPIFLGSPESEDTSHLISRLENANTESGYALQPVQTQAKTSMKKSDLSTTASKRKAPLAGKTKKRQRTAT